MKRDNKEPQLALRQVILLLVDVGAINLATLLAVLIRYDFHPGAVPAIGNSYILQMIPWNTLLGLIIFYLFGLYRSLWRYASLREFSLAVVACICLGGSEFILDLILGKAMPDGYFAIKLLLLLLFTIGFRFSYRLLRLISSHAQTAASPNKINVMIIGAGDAGNTIMREIESSSHVDYVVKCFIDDDPKKTGKYVRSVKIVGGRDVILSAVKKYHIQRIIIAMPSVDFAHKAGIINLCKEAGCEVKVVPGVYQLVNGEVSVSKLRDVDIDDLLGREPVRVNLDEILGYVENKVVMVTGGGGSIGSEICRQLAAHKVRQLIILDIYENTTYEVELELRNKYPNLNLVVLIGSVRSTNRVESIFQKYHPEIIFHAAAHKHVPLMENSPNEAIKNNTMGTWHMALMASKYNAKKFILISTDKAVNPTNIMGASKRLCEMVIQVMDKCSKTEFAAVRFGNVLGSNGSVVPLFKRQIQNGGPVTVTHPDIIRYFMTIPEAVSLVLQAGAYAKGGEIFILNMGEPVKILDLARNLIRLSGYEPDKDIKIEFTGLRPGEKLYEELLMEEEGIRATANNRIFIGRQIDIDENSFLKKLKALDEAAYWESGDIRRKVQELVPEYQPALNGKKVAAN